ncbi:hypothetical protein AM571_CH01050 [Rhizobium etli 8C-3]|uniref:Uncharacterized protein n=1 Tax=Rhizobium etli 8C-3 TaxID=538025 RepID=A0A1L5P157_RHIET|nr:hypothetical protein AM571_CH01050 [Rhizobium etli 8C-3]
MEFKDRFLNILERIGLHRLQHPTFLKRLFGNCPHYRWKQIHLLPFNRPKAIQLLLGSEHKQMISSQVTVV